MCEHFNSDCNCKTLQERLALLEREFAAHTHAAGCGPSGPVSAPPRTSAGAGADSKPVEASRMDENFDAVLCKAFREVLLVIAPLDRDGRVLVGRALVALSDQRGL